MLYLLRLLLGLCCSIPLFWAGLLYDRLPVGWPNAHVALWTLHAPGAGAVSAAKAASDKALADYATERASFAVLKTALSTQDSEVLALKVSGDSWQAQGRLAVAQAVRLNAGRLADARRILALSAPADDSQAGLCKAAEKVLREPDL
jgi:hypothetical protein